MNTLPDSLRPGLRLVSVGINPSLPAARAGYAFANPRNRFWPALRASGLAPAELVPGRAAVEILLREHGIGFTDVAPRPSAMAHELTTAELRAGAQALHAKLLAAAPGIVWFHGTTAARAYLRHALGGKGPLELGEQPFRIGASSVWITPNPSPANARYALADLVAWYRRLKAALDAGPPLSPARDAPGTPTPAAPRRQ